MDKNWLIRTKSNHILGPISKEKVLELYHNGSIKPDDEVCSGNGYWFFIREDDLVAKYLLGKSVQGFNPISEAKDVLTQSGENHHSEDKPDDITMVGGLNLSMLKEAPPAAAPVPPAPEVISPVPGAVKASTTSTTKEPASSDTKKKNNLDRKVKNQTPAPAKKLKKQNWLKYAGVLGFLFLFCLIYFRKTIIQHLFHGEITASFQIMNVAQAQDVLPEKKKSS
jgi:hypothetical protein